ncbi:MAG TPA: fumarylacetoacetate hydrolase family protein [Streptosporangiaceae bacterium]|nr:fumarylacetoacetate hydrolase family protein [Streptosporangiaceae bacterium]
MTLLTFTEYTLPLCVFSHGADSPRVGAGLGTHIIDLERTFADQTFAVPSLNAFLARGPRAWQRTRERLLGFVRGGQITQTVPIAEATLHLPFEVADFTDFFSSLEHATNAARILRPDDPGLQRNWREMPVGYHGRAGTVVVSGTPVVRPQGQVAPGHGRSALAPTRRLDFEAELGFVVGVGSSPGQQVPIGEFARHVFGVVLLIDWSARDIQAFESRPLGPFLGKSFATTISPWVIPLAALDQARVLPPAQDPQPLDYLRTDQPWGLDIDLAVSINGQLVSRPRFATMYWTAAQQLAHLTVNGAALRTGDLYGSGTVSSFRREEQGSLLELTWGGREPITLADGQARGYLVDGDTVTLSASAPGPDGSRIEFGCASGRIAGAPGLA